MRPLWGMFPLGSPYLDAVVHLHAATTTVEVGKPTSDHHHAVDGSAAERDGFFRDGSGDDYAMFPFGPPYLCGIMVKTGRGQ